MKIEITDKQLEKLQKHIQNLIDGELDNLREESQDWGLGEMDELEELESVKRIEIDRIVPYTGLNVYLNFYVSGNREDFDNIRGTIQYLIGTHFPNIKLFFNDIIYED
jgi:hypothetical protein